MEDNAKRSIGKDCGSFLTPRGSGIFPAQHRLLNESNGLVSPFEEQVALESKNDITTRDYVAFVRRNIFLITAVATSIVLSMGIFLYMKNPIYVAVATLEVSSYAPPLPGNNNVEDSFTNQTRGEDYINTLTAQLLSPSVANQVLAREDVKNELALEEARLDAQAYTQFSKWIRAHLAEQWMALKNRLVATPKVSAPPDATSSQERAINSYLGSLIISPVFKTTLIKIEAQSTSPKLASIVANAHAESFINRVSGKRRKLTTSKLEFLRKQADELEEQIKLTEKKLADYAEEHAIVNLDESKSVVIKQLEGLNTLLTAATAKRLRSEGELLGANGAKGRVIDDLSLTNISTSLREAESEYASLAMKYNDSYPRMKELLAKIHSLRQQSGAALEAQYNLDQETEQKIEEQLLKIRDKVFLMSKEQVGYNIIEGEYESLRNLRHSVLAQIEQARLGAENEESNVTLSEPAIQPLFPSYPRKSFLMMATLVAAVAFGVIAALFREKLDTSFRNSEDIENFLAAPVLGEIPDFDCVEFEETGPNINYANFVLSRIVSGLQHEQQLATYRMSKRAKISTVESCQKAAEAFKFLRTNLLLSSVDFPPKVVAVTSAVKGEGKTTVAANLAVALSQVSGKTVIVESDLRNPGLGMLFNIDRTRPGLVEYLLGQASLDEVLLPTESDSLFVLPSGIKSPNPSELATSGKMRDLISALAELFGFVVIDTPPVLGVSDALALSRLAHGVVLVIKSRHTRRELVRSARVQLQRVGCRLLGVVVNKTAKESADVDQSEQVDYIHIQQRKNAVNQ